jgi:Family of unknown function (DUF6159)
MPGTFSDSWKLTKTSFRLLREDRALLVFPVVAGLSILGVLALLFLGFFGLLLPLAAAQGGITGPIAALGLVLFLLAYFAMVLLSVYCTAALVGAATVKLAGQQATAADGWRIARRRLRRLLLWALVTGTVGLAIQAISSRVRGLGGFVIGAVGGATWAVATYFMIPVLLYEEQGAWSGLRRSAQLFTSNFGRSFVSNLVVGLIVGAGIVAAVFLGVAGLFLIATSAVLLGIGLVVIGIAIGVLVALVGAAAEGILRAALYRYATTGKVDPDLVPPSYRILGAH